MKKTILLIITLFVTVQMKAQYPQRVVQNYVQLLNDWLASPYDIQKKKKLTDILCDGSDICTMKDEIVELFNSDAGASRCSRETYLTIFSRLTTKNTVRVEIVSVKNTTDADTKKATAVLKYSGGINLITATDFWIPGGGISSGGITYIVSNDAEIFKLRSGEPKTEDTQDCLYQDKNRITFPVCAVISEGEIESFCAMNLDKCKNWVSEYCRSNQRKYTIPQQIIDKEPCLVYLIINSISMKASGIEETQKRFDIYSQMEVWQVNRLYQILLEEKRKLYSIELKYRY